MNIVYSSSDYYAECTGVSLYSLYENNMNSDVDVYILSSNITEENKKRLHDIAQGFDRKLEIIDAENGFREAAKKYDFETMRGSYSTYARIILNYWLSFLDKVIVIDSDTLVTGSLQEMWDTDLADYYYGAVPEVSMYGKYNYFEDRDIIFRNPIYFNAGICIVNLKKWRDDKIDDYLAEEINKDGRSYQNSEQSIMNFFLGDKIKRIDLKYNFYTTFHFAKYSTIDRLFYRKHIIDENEYRKAKRDPGIIHYCGFPFERPWFRYSVAYEKKRYLDTRDKTGWRGKPLKKWTSRGSTLKQGYDCVAYMLMSVGVYDFCLKFRLEFAQMIKGKLKGIKDNIAAIGG